jgi:hypothetical protein
MIMKRELALEEQDVARLDNAYDLIKVELQKINTPKVQDPVPKDTSESIQEKIINLASSHIGEIEYAFDQFLLKDEAFDVKDYIKLNEVKAPIASKIGQWFKLKIPEFVEAQKGVDKDLCEAYEYLGKRRLKRAINFLEELVAACDNMAIVARTTRAPRVRKAQPPSKLVANMKYQKEYPLLGLKSVHPEKVIGATELWLFDTEKRRLIKYQAQDGSELSVKGTTVMNFSPEKSGSKIIRKPDVQLKGVTGFTKRPMNALFNEIKGTMGSVRGRTSDTQLILKVF